MWRLIICNGMSCFQSSIFLTLPKWLFTFGVYQRLIYWHPPVPLNVTIITARKCHYLWDSWG